MNNFTNKLYILTEHNETYQQLVLEHALPDLEITENAAEADIVLAAPPLAVERLNEFTKLGLAAKHICGYQCPSWP